jgi:uncharacterized protein YndB with AHSA1/START domain
MGEYGTIFTQQTVNKRMKNNITANVNISIKAPVSKVWDALTKPEIIKQYFFGTDAKSDWEVGGPVTFKGEWEGKTYEDKGIVTASEPNKLLSYSYWSSMSGKEDKPENYANVTYELTQRENETNLSITQDNIADEKTKEHSVQNWKSVLNDLKKLLEK